jgi:hypothetical protein
MQPMIAHGAIDRCQENISIFHEILNNEGPQSREHVPQELGGQFYGR